MLDDHAASPDAPRIFESRFRARSYELDGFGHVNHAVFLNWFEQARFDALESGGHPAGAMVAEGWAVVVVRVEVDYRAEVVLGDEVTVRTRVEEARGSSMTLAQRATRRARADAPREPDTTDGSTTAEGEVPDEAGGTVVAEARVVAVWMRGGRPTRIPGAIREALGAPRRGARDGTSTSP